VPALPSPTVVASSSLAPHEITASIRGDATRESERMPARLNNHSTVRRAVDSLYPRSLRRQGIGGTTQLWVWVDEGGIPRDNRVFSSSGIAELDQVAQQVVPQMRFHPTFERGERVAAWTLVSIDFAPR
jgi:TonB family protein